MIQRPVERHIEKPSQPVPPARAPKKTVGQTPVQKSVERPAKEKPEEKSQGKPETK